MASTRNIALGAGSILAVLAGWFFRLAELQREEADDIEASRDERSLRKIYP